jgi:hypothetical protein
MSEKKEDTRSKALSTTLKKACKIVKDGLVTPLQNNEYLVTSSDRKKTYHIHSTAMGKKLHFTCNCGEQFNQGSRTSCKHIFAIVLSSLETISSSFFQIATSGSVENILDICEMASRLSIDPKPKESNPAKQIDPVKPKVVNSQNTDFFGRLLGPRRAHKA